LGKIIFPPTNITLNLRQLLKQWLKGKHKKGDQQRLFHPNYKVVMSIMVTWNQFINSSAEKKRNTAQKILGYVIAGFNYKAKYVYLKDDTQIYNCLFNKTN